ncbi:NAD(P)-binding domain-containing protein [Labedaea rhizosphaerae]|uniref:Thioredoxin reductase n=1 Tax=Labedaea rhizosphaerae TaxID=598644 RepID=A0A4R6S837_LABRH|nr:NAD(P)-binding domain-containing protein [Labedaea rhizosphaerae]TDP94995.1 thioredoxin reductase [Labedaea rhizosphaerae]
MPSDVSTQCLVLGAGPAGLQASYLLARDGRDHLVLEAGERPGAFFTRFPRHRTMISNNKVVTGYTDPELNLRMDWNSLLNDDPELLFTRYTPKYFPPADEFVRYLGDFATKHDLPVRLGTRVAEITRPDDFVVRDQDGNTYRAPRMIVATGVSKPYVPPIEGIELAEPYVDMPVDPAGFHGQRVLVIGRGNSAFETADNLIETAAVIHVVGPGSLKLAWRTHFVGHLRAVNNNFLDTYQLKSQNALLDGTVQSIRREGEQLLVKVAFARVAERVKEIRYDRVLLAAGFRFDASIFASECRPNLTIKDRFPEQTSSWESTNVPDLFFAGTITQARDFKKSTSGFIHGFRYSVRALHRVMEHRYHAVAWPRQNLAASPAAIADAVIARVNRTSALWQQFGFLCDAVLVGRDSSVHYLEEVPVAYLHEAVARGEFGDVDSYFAVTLEYGADHDTVDPFDITAGRVSQESTSGLDGRYLHPAVRRFRAGELIGEHHITENLENEWDSEEVHRAPLVRFLGAQLDPVPA